jgi:hypothetical protein
MARSSSFSKGVAVPGRAQQQAEHVVPLQPPDRFDQDLLAVVLAETAGTQNEMAAVGHAQLAGQADKPVGTYDRRIVPVEVDAGGDDFQPVLQSGGKRARASRATCCETAITASARD